MESSESELINKRFEEHRRRQGLPRELEQDVDVVVDVSLDTGNEGHPPTTAYDTTTTQASGAGGEDKSRKGSVDDRIKDLVCLINSTDDFFTTSTCSGRIILFTNESVQAGPSSVGKKIKKQGCKWLLVSHYEVNLHEFMDAWRKACSEGEGDVSFKVEAAILHVQCRRLSDAKKLVHTATESGFRNSGMVIGGKDNRITVAVRSAIGYEVPLTTVNSENGDASVTDGYLAYLVEKANEKMKENWKRMDKLTQEFRKTFNISA